MPTETFEIMCGSGKHTKKVKIFIIIKERIKFIILKNKF